MCIQVILNLRLPSSDIIHSLLPTARSDRYTHDLVSDEEDGDDEAFQSPFENYAHTSHRFSAMLGQQHQLSFDEESEKGGGTTPADDSISKKKSPVSIVEPKHEKRDSGVAGLEENTDIKILGEHKLNLLGSSEDKSPESTSASASKEQTEEDDDDVETEGEEAAGDGGDTTEEEDEGRITNIDDVMDEDPEEPEPPSVSVPPVVRTTTAGGARPTPPVGISGLSRGVHLTPSPPTTPTRPSDYRPSLDLIHSAPAATTRTTHSEHAQSPLSSSMVATGIASRFKRREARVEDIAQLTLAATHDLDITVSPPTPGQSSEITLCVPTQQRNIIHQSCFEPMAMFLPSIY